MAFTSAVVSQGYMGGMRWTTGTWTTDTTTGDIATGLNRVIFATLQTSGNAVSADQSSIEETFPSGGDLTIRCTSGADGYWFALGD